MSWYSPCSWTWPRESISDENGSADVAYVSVFVVMLVTLGAIPFVLVMSAIEFFACTPLVKPDVIVNCFYKAPGADVGFICGGFSTALLALSGYMAATRKQKKPP